MCPLYGPERPHLYNGAEKSRTPSGSGEGSVRCYNTRVCVGRPAGMWAQLFALAALLCPSVVTSQGGRETSLSCVFAHVPLLRSTLQSHTDPGNVRSTECSFPPTVFHNKDGGKNTIRIASCLPLTAWIRVKELRTPKNDFLELFT